MAITLTRGTKEPVEVQISDNDNQITDLSTSSPHFDIVDDTGTYIVTNGSATANGMLISCPVDTTGWSSTLQHVNLYVKFTFGALQPRLGPYDVYLIGQ